MHGTGAGLFGEFVTIFKKFLYVSHQPERKEKDCLNCGAEVLGPYCQNCGQKNTVVHQSFWQLLTHFVYDIFHFDGKFFDTLKRLLFRPGLVPKEYVQGRRFSYLDPIRMYLFTSAVFFLVFFSLVNLNESFDFTNSRIMSKEERFEVSAHLYAVNERQAQDSIEGKKLALLLDTTKSVQLEKVNAKNGIDSSNLIWLHNQPYKISAFNDSASISANLGENDWVESRLKTKWRVYKRKYGDDVNKMMQDILSRFLHWFPYILFVSLPVFALILKLLYLRRKKYYYSDHAVFTLYHYIFSFILLLLFWSFEALHQKSGWGLFNVLQTMLVIAWPLYLFIAVKRFYAQGWGKTFIKFLFLNLLGLLSIILIFALFSVLFIYQL
jgi:hypothetical protein